MRKLRNLFLGGILALGAFGCSSNSSPSSYNVIVPAGAPTIAFVSQYDDITANGKLDIVDGPDLLQAEFVKESSEYDIIVAPINLGCALIEKEQTDYKLAGVLTWGNLYYVGTSEADLNSTGELALFGEGAVPGKIVELENIPTSLTPVYYSSVTTVQQQLLAGNAKVGLLAEPMATATIEKGKEIGVDFKIITDLQENYPGASGYPQAAVFVKDGVNVDPVLDELAAFNNNGYPELATYLEDITVDALKLPAAGLVVSSIENQNITYKPASDVQDQIGDFLAIFNINFDESMIVQ